MTLPASVFETGIGLDSFCGIASLARLVNDLARAVIVRYRPSAAFCHADTALSSGNVTGVLSWKPIILFRSDLCAE